MKHSKLIFALCLLLGIATTFTSCENKYGSEAMYKGTVINTVNKQPFSNLEVKVTDGEHINVTTKTDENGKFSILVKFNEINANYYLLIGDASCVQVRRDFSGFGQGEINLGNIEVEGPLTATITTLPANYISTKSAISGGNITEDGRSEVTARGVCWSKNEYPTVNDNHTTNGTGKGEFESIITELELGTTYYVRAYATNEIGTSYGQTVMFKTLDGRPVVETLPVGENITGTTITTGGNISDDGGSPVTSRGVVWNTVPYPTLESGKKTTDGSGTGYFGSLIQNVTVSNTNYYIRAYAVNAKGVSYGEQVTVTPDLYKYCNLKTISHGGYKCKIYPVGSMTWQAGYDACENMVFGGYDDWKMADKGEVQAILETYGVWTTYSNCPSGSFVESTNEIWTSSEYSTYKGSVSSAYSYDVTGSNYSSNVPERCTTIKKMTCTGYYNYYYWWLLSDQGAGEVKLVFAVRKYRVE